LSFSDFQNKLVTQSASNTPSKRQAYLSTRLIIEYSVLYNLFAVRTLFPGSLCSGSSRNTFDNLSGKSKATY